MRSVRWLLIGAALAFGSSSSVRASEPVTDNCTGAWEIRVTPDDATAQLGADVFSDAVLFEQGVFSTQAYAPYGYAPSAYTIAGADFNSTLSDDLEGSVVWHGHVDGSTISGDVSWTKSDGHVYHYTFTGQKQVDESQSDGGDVQQG